MDSDATPMGEPNPIPLGERLRIPLMLAPAVLFIALVFGGGLVIGLMQSLGYFPAAGLHDFTFRHYVDVLTDSNFLRSLWLTFRIAAVVTLLSIVVAIAFSMVLRKPFRGSRFATFLYQVPLPVPHLVAAGATLLLFAQSGVFARLLAALGGPATPKEYPAIIYDDWSVGVTIAFLWKEVPFIGLVVLAILQSVGPQYEEIATTLGANSWQRFRHVLLPLIMPGIMSTSIIVFAFTFANYELPLLLGKSFPTTLPVEAYDEFSATDLARRPRAMAIALVIALVSILLLAAYRRLMAYANDRE